MINAGVVYKIRETSLVDGPYVSTGDQCWVHGFNVTTKTGGSGKTFTSKKLVNRMFSAIIRSSDYGKRFTCQIVTFSLEELDVSDEIVEHES